ncbi:MAG: enoyl-CoA hydratase/isomerase family protein [Longimicrobiaceae bacterium]
MENGPRVETREVDEGVRTLLLNRPQKRNALDRRMVSELREGLAAADADSAVRVVTLCGAGEDFCAGADLSELLVLASGEVEENLDDTDHLAALFTSIRRMKKPVVAAVQGRALAGGCGLATACDLVLASEDAEFGYPEIHLGFVPAMVAAMLRRNVAEKRAFELIVLGERIGAAEAERLGLVNRVLSSSEFERGVAAFCSELAGRSASAVALCKRLLYGIDGLAFEQAVRVGAELNVIARMSPDARAGISSFLEGQG